MNKAFNLDGYGALADLWQRAVEERRGETAFIRDGVPVTYGEVNREIASFRMKLHTFKIKSGASVAVVLDPTLRLYKILPALATRGIDAVILPKDTDAVALVGIATDMGLSAAVCARERVGEMNTVREAKPEFIIIDSEVIGDGELNATPNASAQATVIFDVELKLSGSLLDGGRDAGPAEELLYLE